MDLAACAEIRRREGMVIVEPDYGLWVIIRAGIRGFAEKDGQTHDTTTQKTGKEKLVLERAHSLTIKTAPFQTPFSIVSYLNNGPTISSKCGLIFTTLKFRDLSVADIEAIESSCELDVNSDAFRSESMSCGA